MSKPITKIEMTGFRGAIEAFELEFDPQKDLTMLFGENGSGKSTILDAMDVICNGTIGCLDGVSVGRSPGKYLCALGCQAAALRVTVQSDAESWTGTMSRNVISVAGSAEKPTVSILRRNRILDLVLAQPRDRYQALQQFIDIAVVERSEAALKQKRDETSKAIDTLISDKDRMSNQLDNIWEAENRPGPGQTAMAWAENKVETGIIDLTSRLERLKSVVDAIAEAVSAYTNFKDRLTKHTNVNQQLGDMDQKIAASPSVSSTAAIQLLESLDKAKAYIEANEAIEECPTCLRSMDRDELLAIVTREFDQLAELKKLSDDKKRIQGWVEIAASHQREAQTRLVTALKAVEEVTSAGDIAEVVALTIVWPSWDQAAEDMSALVAICSQLEAVQDSLEEHRNDAQRDVNQFNSIKEWWTGINDANVKMADLDRILTGLKKAFDIVHEKRVTFTQGILDSIRQEADRLFQMLHPGENIGLEHLKMEEDRRGSVSQTGVFNGHPDIPPQAVFSESHLDTLGFCVWLALAKRQSPESTILLIDDIFSSVDATHLGRVIDLLSGEAPNFLQVIVATHYRLWWTRSQHAQGIQRIQLGLWDVQNGIRAQNMPSATKQLRQSLAEPILDRQAVASKAGILLEDILNGLSLHYERPLPHNRQNEYTLGALVTACASLFAKYNLAIDQNMSWNVADSGDDWKSIDVAGPFNRIKALQFIRNQVGCHFNIVGMDLPDSDVRAFGEATADLIDAIACPSCGMMASKAAPDNSHLRCSCTAKAIHMIPVSVS